jgi:hypothetical protein
MKTVSSLNARNVATFLNPVSSKTWPLKKTSGLKKPEFHSHWRLNDVPSQQAVLCALPLSCAIVSESCIIAPTSTKFDLPQMGSLFHLVSVIVLALFVLVAILAFVRLLMFFRAKDMLALASRWGFRYIGPSASRLFSPSSRKISLPLPASFSRTWYPAESIRQVWNVIEGQQSGVSVLIFDSVIGKGRGRGVFCTFVAIQTVQNRFGADTSPERLVQSSGWTALYRTKFIQTPGTMNIQRIDEHLNTVRSGIVG